MRASSAVGSVKPFEFHSEDCRLDPVHPRIPADQTVMVFSLLPMVAKNLDFAVELFVHGHHRTRFAKRTEVLAWIKAKTAGHAYRPGLSPLVFRPVSLTGILDHEEPM